MYLFHTFCQRTKNVKRLEDKLGKDWWEKS